MFANRRKLKLKRQCGAVFIFLLISNADAVAMDSSCITHNDVSGIACAIIESQLDDQGMSEGNEYSESIINVSAAPAPGNVWLLASGLFALAGLIRLRR